MAVYEDEILGAPVSVNSGKDGVFQFIETGVVDVYQETLIGGVDYVIGAFGASNGNTLPDPAVLVFNSTGQLVRWQLDGGMAGFGGRDPLFIFQPPALGVGQTDTFYIGVFDQTMSGGSYTLSVEGAGPPISFGGPLGTTFLN